LSTVLAEPAQPPASPRSTATARRGSALGAAAFCFAFLLALFPLRSFDIWWHLTNARELVSGRGLPRENRYSFVCPEYEVVPTHWLFGLGAYLAHLLGGESALVLGKALLVAAAFLVAYVTSRRRSAGPVAAAAVVALAALASRKRFLERPHLLTMLGLAAFAHLLELYRSGSRRAVWALPPLAALWANFHAGCLFGVGLVGLEAAGEAPSADAGGRVRGELRRAVELAAAAGACALAVMLSPALWHVYTYNIWHLRVGEVVPLVEFRTSLPWEQPAFYLLLLAGAALLLADWRAARPAEILVFAIFGALAVYALREIPSFALLACPIVAPRVSAQWGRLRAPAARWLAAAERASAPALWALLLGFPPVAHFAGGPNGKFRIGLGVAQGFFPELGARFVERELPLDRRVFNDLAAGGYLAWNWYPRRQVFVDGRTNAYPPELLRELYRRRVTPELVEGVTRRYGIDAALLFFYKGENPFWGAFDPARWAVVSAEESSLVLLRRTAANRELIARFERELGPRGFEILSRRFAQRGDAHLARAAEAAESALAAEERSGAPEFTPRERAGLLHRKAHGLRLRGETSEAVETYRKALELRPDWSEARANLGFALLESGRPAEARDEFVLALAGRPRPVQALLGLAQSLERLGDRSGAAARYREFLSSGLAGPEDRSRAERALNALEK